MRTPNMNQESAQSNNSPGPQSSSQDYSNLRRARLNSIRELDGSDKDGQRSQSSFTTSSGLNIDTNRLNKARGPINDAVHSVLNPKDMSHSGFSPEMIDQITSQITANVLQQLKQSQFSPTSTNVPSTVNEPMDSVSSNAESPPIDRDKVYTPPSPYRVSEEAVHAANTSSPRKQNKARQSSDVKRPPSPPFSHATLSEDSDTKEGFPKRPRVESSSTTAGDDATILEKIWGDLYDDRGKSTLRLSQFLRGIAVHLIEDYEPKNSLVVTPDKMQKYYEETKQANEIYPWQTIFDDRTSSISRMFREVEAQHHLIQDRLNERPDIPGLTPAGFATWMTLVLKAHPDEEFERLAYTALHMPVSNPDDKKERFPKELSRRQFPKDSDKATVTKLAKIVYTHCDVRVPVRAGSLSERDSRSTHPAVGGQSNPIPPQPFAVPPQSMAVPPQTAPKQSQPDYDLSQTTTRSSIPEIERNTLRQTVSATAAEDPPIATIPPPPIERERKPYVAQPGGGKHYDNLDAPIVQPADSRAGPSGPPPPPTKLTRSASLNTGRPADPRPRPVQPVAVHQKPLQMPPPIVETQLPSRSRTGTYHRDAPRRGDRNRSPSNSRNDGMPQKSDSDTTYGAGPYHSANSSESAPNSWRAENRYERRESFSAEPRDREPRQRFHSISTSDSHRNYVHKDYASEDEVHRPRNNSYFGQEVAEPAHLPPQQYPPTSYKGRA